MLTYKNEKVAIDFHMECNIVRTVTRSKTCTFEMEGQPGLRAVGRRIHGTDRCKLFIYNGDQLEYSLLQKSLLKQFISILPIISFIYQNPFHFYRDEKKCGFCVNKTKFLGQGREEFHFEGDTYLLTIHSMGVHSLLRNGEQVAVYRRYGRGNYFSRFSKPMEDRADLRLLFAAWVELYLTLDTSAGGAPQNYVIPHDKFLDQARWLPADDADKEPFLNVWGRLPLPDTEE